VSGSQWRKKLHRNLNIKILAVGILLLYLPAQAAAGKLTGTVKVKGLRSPANILVYLTKTPKSVVDIANTQFVMDQQNLTFLPHILPIPVGATVAFPNNDKVDHNVFSLSRTKKFNLGSYKPGENKTIRFDKPGMVEVRCDVHAEMLAYIMVMKNPYFAVTDAQGRFEIPDAKFLEQSGIQGAANIPPGKYFIKTWHEKLKTKKQALVVSSQDPVSIQLDLTRGTPSVLYK
jgi:plastocyanin